MNFDDARLNIGRGELLAGGAFSFLDPVREAKNSASIRASQFSQSLVSKDARYVSTSPALLEALDEQLFGERLKLKIAVSQVSMHLSPLWRNIIFTQIDDLFSKESWDDESNFILQSSFHTFLRFIVFSNPLEVPGITITGSGHSVATWASAGNRVHVEFLPKDIANIVTAKTTARGQESVHWRGPVTNVETFLTGFGVASCLGWSDGKADKTQEFIR